MTESTWTLPGFEWPEPSDDAERQTLADVREHKAHVVCVTGEGPAPDFAYTVGLYQQFGHPEVLIVGLPPDVCADVLGEIVDAVEDGGAFADGDESKGILRGFPVRFVTVPRPAYGQWLGAARWFYSSLGEDAFPCVQVLWPARNGRFPGQKGSPPWMKQRQPVLGTARP